MKTFPGDYLRRISSDIFKACRTPEDEAGIVAEHLVNANLMGFDSHGVIRVPQYVLILSKVLLYLVCRLNLCRRQQQQ